jgi:hypothetical protein
MNIERHILNTHAAPLRSNWGSPLFCWELGTRACVKLEQSWTEVCRGQSSILSMMLQSYLNLDCDWAKSYEPVRLTMNRI